MLSLTMENLEKNNSRIFLEFSAHKKLRGIIIIPSSQSKQDFKAI